MSDTFLQADSPGFAFFKRSVECNVLGCQILFTFGQLHITPSWIIGVHDTRNMTHVLFVIHVFIRTSTRDWYCIYFDTSCPSYWYAPQIPPANVSSSDTFGGSVTNDSDRKESLYLDTSSLFWATLPPVLEPPSEHLIPPHSSSVCFLFNNKP